MGTFRFQLAVSLDGFVAGPDQSEENPLGVGGLQLHQWIFKLEVWRWQQGEEGGEVNASTPVVEEAQANVGATVMGRNMFGGGPAPGTGIPRGGAGGARTLLSTRRCSCSPTIPASRWRWRAAPPSSSSLMGSRPRSSRPSRPQEAGMCCSAGAPALSSSTWPPGWSMSSSGTSPRSCSGTASDC